MLATPMQQATQADLACRDTCTHVIIAAVGACNVQQAMASPSHCIVLHARPNGQDADGL